MCVTTSAALEQLQDFRQRRKRLADVEHEPAAIGGEARAAHRFEIVIAGHVLRQPDLHAGDPLAMLRDGAARGVDVRRLDVHQLALPGHAGPRHVQEDPDAIRRRLRHTHQRVDVVGAGRSAVDHRGDALAQQRGPASDSAAPTCTWRSISPGVTIRPAAVEHVRRIGARDARLDRADAAAFDRDVGDAIEPARRIRSRVRL